MSYKRPLVLGVNCQRHYAENTFLAQSLADLGHNTGNMIFAEGLFRSLKHAVRSDYHFEPEVVNDCDVVVVAAANWLNDSEDFGWIYTALEQLNLPVVIVGLGVQTTETGISPRICDGTMNLVRLASRTSGKIGVRGELSAQVLRSLGVENVQVVGCPSFLAAGSAWAVDDVILDESNVLIHGTRHLFEGADALNRYIYRQAFVKKMDILLQSELADMYFALQRLNNTEITKIASRTLTDCYGSDIDQISEYLKVHGRVHFDYDGWLASNEQYSFVVGTRLHGTIASLLSGIPSLLLCHDDRTREIAKVMPLPAVDLNKIDIDSPLDISALRALINLDELQEKFVLYRAKFEEFMSANGLEIH